MKLISLNIVTIFYFILALNSCSDERIRKNNNDKNEFEGKIIYKIELSGANSNLTNKFYDKNGNKLIFSYKKGNYRQDYYDRNNRLIRSNIYIQNENALYSSHIDSISIYKSDVSIKSTEFTLLKKEKSKEKILDHNCNYIFAQYSNDSVPWLNNKMEFWGSTDLKLNQSYFKKFVDGHINKIYKSLGSFPIKFTLINERTKTTYTAIEIINNKISDKIFKIDMDKPIINWDWNSF